MIDADLCKEIYRFGRKVVAQGLTSSRFGNISALRENKILITCTGSMLDELDQTKVVAVDLLEPCTKDALASTELCVHRAIYDSTSAVALSLIENGIVRPIDGEGLHFLGPMPVVEAGFGTDELARKVSSALESHNACIARGHGVFAAGGTLAEAFTRACMAEHSSQVSYLVRSIR
jgi:L-fuculose-phosphate aldolase